MHIDQGSIQAFEALLLGFAAAGLIATGFEALTARRASFRLLETGDPAAIAIVPVVVLSAPFILLRHAAVRPRHQKGRVATVMLTTIIACLWSLICGSAWLDVLALL